MSPAATPPCVLPFGPVFAKDSLHFMHVHKTALGTGWARVPPSLTCGSRGPETSSDLLMAAQQFVVVLLRAPQDWSCAASPRPAWSLELGL